MQHVSVFSANLKKNDPKYPCLTRKISMDIAEKEGFFFTLDCRAMNSLMLP